MFFEFIADAQPSLCNLTFIGDRMGLSSDDRLFLASALSGFRDKGFIYGSHNEKKCFSFCIVFGLHQTVFRFRPMRKTWARKLRIGVCFTR